MHLRRSFLHRSFVHRSLVRRFLFFLFALALSPSPPLVAQSSPGAKTFTLKAANQIACIGTANLPTVAIIVTGTFSATLQPQVSINGSTPQNSQVTPTTSSTAQATITTAGNYVAAVGGFDTFCLNVSSYASGAATVVLNPSPALNAGLIGGAAGNSTAAASNGVYAANGYGLYNDGQFILDATITNGQNTISCANSDCNFTAADNGKICFATNLSTSVPNWASVVVLPQGTLTVTGAQTATCSGGNATGNGGTFVWGHDDTTPLANAFAAAFGVCSNLILPGINAQKTGPAVMLVQAAEFGITGNGSGFLDCRQSPLDTGRGIGITGQGSKSTWIIPTPSFNFSTCTFASQNVCFFGTPEGQVVTGLTIWGAGNSNPGSAAGSRKGAAIKCSNWCGAYDLALLGWGANTTNGLVIGLYADAGLYGYLDHVNVDGFGGGGNNPAVFAANVTITASNFLNTQGPIMEVGPGSGSGGATSVNSFGNQFVNSFSSTVITIDNSAQFNSYADVFGPTNSNSSIITVTGTGIANLSDDYIFTAINSAKGITISASGGSARLKNTAISMTGTTTTGISNAGSYFDQGGNTISATTPYSGAGNIFGSLSITGTTQTAGNVALTNFGGSPSVGTVSGDSRVEQFTITIGGTPTGTATMTVTFPTPFLAAPICNAPIVGGTNTSLGSFTTGTVSTTSAAFTYVGTLVGADTLVVQVNCQ